MGERILAVVLTVIMLLQTGLGVVTSDDGREQPQTRVQEEVTQGQRQDIANRVPEVNEKYNYYWEDDILLYKIGQHKEGDLLEDNEAVYAFSTSIDKQIKFQFQFSLPYEISPDNGEVAMPLEFIRVGIFQAKEDFGDYEITKLLWTESFWVDTDPVSIEKQLLLKPGSYLIVFSTTMDDDMEDWVIDDDWAADDWDIDDGEDDWEDEGWDDIGIHYSFLTKDVSNYATSLSIQNKLSMYKKDKVSIKVSDVKPAGALKGITWKTSDKQVAKVDQNGKVTAVNYGKCEISATLRNGTKYICMVYVENPDFVKYEYILNKGETKKLELKNTFQPVVWESSAPSVAQVNHSGKVTARKKGDATITAYIGEQVLECDIHVDEPKISSKKKYILKGKKADLELKGTKQKVKWSSSNKKVATVTQLGKVKAKKPGKAIITAKVGESKYNCTVIVEENQLKKTFIKVAVKGRMPIGVKKKTKIIKWSSSNKKIATVKNGVVTGKKEGTVVIKAKSKHLTYTCKVRVEDPYLYTKSIVLHTGSDRKLEVSHTTIKPKWSSSNKKVATVNDQGKVVGKREGKAVITANVGGRKFKCKVNVTVWKPNYTVWMVKDESNSTPLTMLGIRNNGSEVMRVYARNTTLIDAESAEYNRELKLFSYNDFMVYNVIKPLSYIDIAPGKEAYLPYEINPPTRYSWTSTIYFDFKYDGVEYRASNSRNYGYHYVRK